MIRPPLRPILFPYTTLFRSWPMNSPPCSTGSESRCSPASWTPRPSRPDRSEEHTSELQSRGHLVCRLLLEKKKTQNRQRRTKTNERTDRQQSQEKSKICRS